MPKKRKRKPGPDSAEDSVQAPKLTTPGLATAFGPLLERAGLNKLAPATRVPAKPRAAPAPSKPALLPSPEPARPRAPHAAGELSALNRAYLGVRPIARPKRDRVKPAVERAPGVATSEHVAEDAAARERLSQLVAGGVRFAVQWDDGLVEGLRAGVSPKLTRGLPGASFEPDRTLDLHGMRSTEALRAVHDFVRAAQRSGARHLLIIVGKGIHSEDGVGVLAEVAVRALSQGGAAPLVAAFASSHNRHGGRGALAVLLG